MTGRLTASLTLSTASWTRDARIKNNSTASLPSSTVSLLYRNVPSIPTSTSASVNVATHSPDTTVRIKNGHEWANQLFPHSYPISPCLYTTYIATYV